VYIVIFNSPDGNRYVNKASICKSAGISRGAENVAFAVTIAPSLPIPPKKFKKKDIKSVVSKNVLDGKYSDFVRLLSFYQ